MIIKSIGVNRLLRVYIILALIVAAILSSLPFSFIPVLLILWRLFMWLWPVSPSIKLFTNYFTLFALTIFYGPILGPWFSSLLSLPAMALVNHDLQEVAKAQYYHDTRHSLSITRMGIALPLIALLVLLMSLLLGNIPLLLASIVSLVYSIAMGAITITGMPSNPLQHAQVNCRIVAGSEDDIQLDVIGTTRIGGVLFLVSPYEWLKISPAALFLRPDRLNIKVHIAPQLSGQTIIKINAYAMDRWGLIQVRFSFEPLLIYVIPRAKYAEWLAQKYLGETNPGSVYLSSNRLATSSIYGLRRGVEYFGSRRYQPGDSLKTIDWKGTTKHHELISKEFLEFHGQSVIALVNLSVGNEEEADKLIYWIIITALTLARENIPTILAAYDHEKVQVVTPVLDSRRLVVQSLEISKGMVTYINPVKYLNPPDIARLRSDIGRLNFANSEASRKLASLLEIEYANLSSQARLNPSTLALLEAFLRGESQSNILVISHRNHDAVALAVNTERYSRKGNSIIPIFSAEKKHKSRELAKV